MKTFFLGFFDKSIVTKSTYRQYVLFFVIGLFCFIIDISTLRFLKEVAGKNIYLSIGVAFIIATYINYLLNIKYVFIIGKHKKAKEVTFFFLTACVSFLLTLGAMLLFLEVLTLNYIFAKMVTVFLVSIFSFLVRKIIIFKN